MSDRTEEIRARLEAAERLRDIALRMVERNERSGWMYTEAPEFYHDLRELGDAARALAPATEEGTDDE